MVQFRVDTFGNDFSPPIVDLFGFTSADCSGTAFVHAPVSSLMTMAFDDPSGGGRAYAMLPGQPRALHSTAVFIPSGQSCEGFVLPSGRCCLAKDLNPLKPFAEVAPFNLQALGCVPPFHVEGP